MENRYGNAQQKRFDEPAFTDNVPDACHALETWRQIDFFMLDARNDLTDYGVDRADFDLLGIEGSSDFTGILSLGFETAVLIDLRFPDGSAGIHGHFELASDADSADCSGGKDPIGA